MYRRSWAFACAFFLLFLCLTPLAAIGAESLSSPSSEQRLSDVEAYINNTARSADAANATVTSRINGSGPGHNGWMMISTALVLFMTLPGLALFYGGLVRSKNVLSVLAQCLGLTGLVTLLWWAVGYSLVFAPGGPFLGGLDYAFFNGVDSMPNTTYSYWVSHNIFAMYQMMFAIITPALIVGAIAERMKFSALLLFVTVWMFAVYFPVAHMMWGSTGFMNGIGNGSAAIKAIDFSGGIVAHMTSGWSALVLCMIVGRRRGWGREVLVPHSMVLCMIGTGMLWVGWYGFNAGSALAADGIAANAFTTTTLAAAVASFVWAMLEYIINKKPSILGFCSGAIAGLAVITPACGFVDTNGAMIIGIFAGLVPFLAVFKLKEWLGYDDALDTFGVHAVGGTLGAFLAGIFATVKVNPNLSIHLSDIVGHTLWREQLKAMGITAGLSIVATAIIAYGVKALIGLRPSDEAELKGLDIAEHGEVGYRFFNI